MTSLLAALPHVILGWIGAEPCPAHLFVIDRSKNANVVVYDAIRGPDGGLLSADPVMVYWLLNGDEARHHPLNSLERDRAYGFETKPGDVAGTYTLFLKADRRRPVTVRVRDGCAEATTRIGDQVGVLQRLFVRSDEKFIIPKVEYIEFFGRSLETDEPVYEKFVPGK